jgi:hypothetical protein
MKMQHSTVRCLGLAIIVLLTAFPAAAQWAAEPGATVRDAFGPKSGLSANQCRGACGGGCPDSCVKTVSYECMDSARLRRVVSYDCGTHPGCRVHDDCLDACIQNGTAVRDCSSQCDVAVIQQFGFESSASWLTGGGPYDGRITFEYTRDTPDALVPAFHCPAGAERQCAPTVGCKTDDGAWVDPVFESYPTSGSNAMRVSNFRSGPACGDSVCSQATNIQINGKEQCPGGSCSRFGMEFDYENADPSAPLECSTSTSGDDDDFVGDLLKQGADAMTSREDSADAGSSGGQGEDGMAELMSMFGKVLASADSPEDVQISIAPLGPDGKPIESQRVGSEPRDGPPPIPHSVNLPGATGHLFIPMYQLAGNANLSSVKERKVICTHKGVAVVETVFRLNPQ